MSYTVMGYIKGEGINPFDNEHLPMIETESLETAEDALDCAAIAARHYQLEVQKIRMDNDAL